MSYFLQHTFDRFEDTTGCTYEITVDGVFYHFPSEYDDYQLRALIDEHVELDLYVTEIAKFDEEGALCWKQTDPFIGPAEEGLPVVGVTHVDHLPQAEQDEVAEKAWDLFLGRVV